MHLKTRVFNSAREFGGAPVDAAPRTSEPGEPEAQSQSARESGEKRVELFTESPRRFSPWRGRSALVALELGDHLA
jgi:hypothetical protein